MMLLSTLQLASMRSSSDHATSATSASTVRPFHPLNEKKAASIARSHIVCLSSVAQRTPNSVWSVLHSIQRERELEHPCADHKAARIDRLSLRRSSDRDRSNARN
ncbi:hypothetical protein PsorP6_007498 [Peronosclerospora sorghi]|uniref:Uncharacterized protein n=1 Tax=Peronosclerospora sorghi TaxID=230839 RepID=A0ACC0WAN5_9STRA|nr:hypothetical protein PsorP6_007498 [Peronosclerospora sorghi]